MVPGPAGSCLAVASRVIGRAKYRHGTVWSLKPHRQPRLENMAREKDVLLTLRLSRRDRDHFHDVARAEGVSLSELVRRLVRSMSAGNDAPEPDPR